MNITRQIHTIYLKHDSSFKTLAKKSLAQIIIKILFINKQSMGVRQLIAEIKTATAITYSEEDLRAILSSLVKEKSLGTRLNKYYLTPNLKDDVAKKFSENESLHKVIYQKYFSTCETANEHIIEWFQEATILFFEKFSFEWFSQVTKKGKFTSNAVDSLDESIDESLQKNSSILECDKEWLKKQYLKFIDSEEADENLLFWNYGVSMFASRLLAAKNFKDELTLDIFKNGRMILDTNILMILDLEAHELNKSFENLEEILSSLEIDLIYLNITKDEYTRAMSYRKDETVRVFDSFDRAVLTTSDCPYIRTALRRECRNGDDVKQLFDQLVDLPSVFHEKLAINELDYGELDSVIEKGRVNENLKAKLNAIHKRRTKREKRDRPLSHDSGMIEGAYYLRDEKKTWILTNDGSLKLYAIENIRRDQSEIAIGLDVLLAILAINNNDIRSEASNFAPLFKNLIKLSLIPDAETFEVEDLARMLNANLRLNELEPSRIIEIAQNVKRMRIQGDSDENISLYLNRSLEKESAMFDEKLKRDMAELDSIRLSKDKLEKERDVAFDALRVKRRGELRDKYDNRLFWNRITFFTIPTVVAVILFFIFRVFANNTSNKAQIIVGILIELVFGILPLWFIHSKIRKRHSEYVNGIDSIVEKEIIELKEKADKG